MDITDPVETINADEGGHKIVTSEGGAQHPGRRPRSPNAQSSQTAGCSRPSPSRRPKANKDPFYRYKKLPKKQPERDLYGDVDFDAHGRPIMTFEPYQGSKACQRDSKPTYGEEGSSAKHEQEQNST